MSTTSERRESATHGASPRQRKAAKELRNRILELNDAVVEARESGLEVVIEKQEVQPQDVSYVVFSVKTFLRIEVKGE